MMKMLKHTFYFNFLFHKDKLFAFLSKIAWTDHYFLDPRLLYAGCTGFAWFILVISETIFAHIVPVSNGNEKELRAL